MAVRFSEEQVLKATGARRLRSGSRASYEHVCTDTRQLTPGCLFVALKGERFDAHQFVGQAAAGGAAAAIIQRGRAAPSVPQELGLFEVEDTLAALGALARFHRQRFKGPVGAVGGSNGKTTTKEMVGAILATRGPALKTEGNLNNEVGVPLTLFRLEPAHVAAVVEVGMNNPGELRRLTDIVQPDAGLITVVQPEHLEGLGSIEGVAQAEGELFEGLSRDACAVVNRDDALIVAQARRTRSRALGFGRAAEADVRLVATVGEGRAGQRVTVEVRGERYEVPLGFVGEHNALNATGAFALGIALGFRPEECVRGLSEAKPYARRLNVLDAPGGVTVLDDCYNANPASMDAALATLRSLSKAGRAVAILGDMLELGPGELEEHRALGGRASGAVDLLALFGPRSKAGHEAASRSMGERVAHFEEDVDALIAWLSPRLRAGDWVLVKGSRGMRLERAVLALTGRSPSPGGH